MTNLFITPTMEQRRDKTELTWKVLRTLSSHNCGGSMGILLQFWGWDCLIRNSLICRKYTEGKSRNFELPGVNKIAKSSVINDQMVAICFATSSQGLLFTLRGWHIWLQSRCMSLTLILLVRDEQFQALIRFRVSGFKHIKHFSTHEDSKHSLPSFSS